MAGGFLGRPFDTSAIDLRAAAQAASRESLGSDRGKPTMCAFVLEEDPRERVEFESYPADGITEGYAATFKNIDFGIAPQPASRMYVGGDWNQLVFDLDFRAGDIQRHDGARDLNALASEMERKVRLLQAFSFPKPDKRRAPNEKAFISAWRVPFALLILGDFITYRGYVETTEIRWQMPVVTGSVRPMAAGVTVTFLPTMAVYPDFYDVQDPNLRGSTVDVVDALIAQGGTREDILTLGKDVREQQLAAEKAIIAELERQLQANEITQEQFDAGMKKYKDKDEADGKPIPSRPR